MNSMRDVILKQHEQIPRSLDVNKDVSIKADVDSIILAGLGGSGHPGDLLNALGIANVPLYVHRNYDLPLDYLHHMGLTKPLVIASSYSGNTEETITAYQAAKKNKLPILVSSSGGTLAKQAQQDDIPAVTIDFPGMQPRHTLFAAFSGIYAALANSKLVENITEQLHSVAKTLEDQSPELEATGKYLAEKIKDKVPVYTSSDSLGFATKNFKIQTNENAKYPAFWNTFPELNHNELVGFSKLKESNHPNKFIVIMLRDDNDHPRVKARMDVTADLYQSWGVAVEQVSIPGESILERLFLATVIGLWTTSYLAEAYNIDPVPVEGVEDFKEKLKRTAGEV